MEFKPGKGRAPRVLVAMSGGVDSSVAAALLVEQGYDVVGATMQVWDYSNCDIEEGNGTCCSSIDVDDARAVADKLDIPFYVINCESQFRQAVIDPFISDYLKGETPVPCVNCNTFLKFDHLVQKMIELECDFLATGHYAKIDRDSKGQPAIVTSADDWKDQTYFLFTIKASLVSKLIFPLGDMKKPAVRDYAEKAGLGVARKKDSTGICFVGDKSYVKFIESQVPNEKLVQRKGVFRRLPDGRVVGEHPGIHHFTIGQSKGLGLDHHEKLFVVRIDAADNTVWLGEESYLFEDEMNVYDTHLLSEIEEGERLRIKIRFHHHGSEAQVYNQGGGHFKIKFTEKQRAITLGQAAVFYRDKQLLGGGWIRS